MYLVGMKTSSASYKHTTRQRVVLCTTTHTVFYMPIIIIHALWLCHVLQLELGPTASWICSLSNHHQLLDTVWLKAQLSSAKFSSAINAKERKYRETASSGLCLEPGLTVLLFRPNSTTYFLEIAWNAVLPTVGWGLLNRPPFCLDYIPVT